MANPAANYPIQNTGHSYRTLQKASNRVDTEQLVELNRYLKRARGISRRLACQAWAERVLDEEEFLVAGIADAPYITLKVLGDLVDVAVDSTVWIQRFNQKPLDPQ